LVNFILALPKLTGDVADLAWTVIRGIGSGIKGVLLALGDLIYKYMIKPVIDFMNAAVSKIYELVKEPFDVMVQWINEYFYKPIVEWGRQLTHTIAKWFGLEIYICIAKGEGVC